MINPVKLHLVVAPLVGVMTLSGCAWQSDLDALHAENQKLQQQVATQSAEIARLQGAIKYTVNSDLLFPSGGWEMSNQGQQIIAKMASQLTPTQQNKIEVHGFTDNAPIGPALQRRGVTSNQILSEKRAENVMQYLISQGMRPDLVSAKGFGDAYPIGPNSTPAGRAQNRRVELTLAATNG
jgi:chemotaxis protein MotB